MGPILISMLTFAGVSVLWCCCLACARKAETPESDHIGQLAGWLACTLVLVVGLGFGVVAQQGQVLQSMIALFVVSGLCVVCGTAARFTEDQDRTTAAGMWCLAGSTFVAAVALGFVGLASSLNAGGGNDNSDFSCDVGTYQANICA